MFSFYTADEQSTEYLKYHTPLLPGWFVLDQCFSHTRCIWIFEILGLLFFLFLDMEDFEKIVTIFNIF